MLRNRVVPIAGKAAVREAGAMDAPLTDGTVTLTPLGPGDLDAHLAGEDEELVRWLTGAPVTPASLRAHLDRCERWWAQGGPFHNFGIRIGEDHRLGGTIEVQIGQDDLKPGQANLAYGLYPQWRGKGLATRAVLLACEYAARLGCAEAVIRCEPANTRSAAVAARAGFAFLQRRSEPDGKVLDWHVRDLRP
jgi:RimJ/RimL family protein N-acetyltransferase